jgi:hypothetical protein
MLWPWPLTSNLRETVSFFFTTWWSSVPCCMIHKLTVQCLSCLQNFSANTLTLTFDLCPWQTVHCFISSKWSRAPSCILRFSLYSQYLPLLCFNTKWCYEYDLESFDLKLWQTIGFFFSSWLSSVLSCVILILWFGLYPAYKLCLLHYAILTLTSYLENQ